MWSTNHNFKLYFYLNHNLNFGIHILSSLIFITHFSVHGPSIIAEQTIHTKEAMDDETFDTMMPVKKLGGKYSGPPSDTVNSNEKVTS